MVDKVLLDPRLESATAFALSDVDQIVEEQFAVAPRFGANHDRVPDADTTRVLGNDLSAPSDLSEFAAFRERDPIDNQHSNALTIPDTGQTRISHVLRT